MVCKAISEEMEEREKTIIQPLKDEVNQLK